MINYFPLLLGHMVGDYWFQTDEEAIKKSQGGELGNFWCTCHCVIYSLCVSLFVVIGGWRYGYEDKISDLGIICGSLCVSFFIAFITHYPIDRISFAHKWMKWFNIIDFEKAPPNITGTISQAQVNLRSFFVAPVYIIIDNSMHLVLMYILFSLLGK